MVCSGENIDRISGVMEPWSVGQDALEFVSAMNYEQFSDLPDITARERLWMTSALSSLGFSTVGDPRANYFVVRIPDVVDGQMLEAFLNARNILVKMMDDIQGAGKFCRIAVKRHEYNEVLVESFTSFMKSLGDQDE
jgi:histidinol-phosphate/aromatic aminotransferase/cobyric acid decarboxylase-like protein